MVVLNNHQGRAMWCCSEDDGEGLWYSKDYPEEAWISSLKTFAQRYKEENWVIGYDIRNEPRGVPAETFGSYRRPHWADANGPEDLNWPAAALKGGLAVVEEDPNALVFVEGLDFATDLSGLRNGGKLHEHEKLLGRVVYEVHDYTWYHTELLTAWYLHWLCLGWSLFLVVEFIRRWFQRRSKGASSGGLGGILIPMGNDGFHGFWPFGAVPLRLWLGLCIFLACLSWWLVSYSHFSALIDQKWGFLLHDNVAPVWLGEFGTNGFWVTDAWWMEVGEVVWWRNILRYISENRMDFAYWALNGDKLGQDETFGLLQDDYQSLRHPWLLEMLP
eukprot:TRINITY_DN51778_c0_g1_i1.p1 TRINITY_DN51778_c0_g1~~TRINITY_DN51778_c0_g1_i1.p1  ORF type:complete len:363 (-),score=36.26 TRINITY_DN51778_c0_g1_i1:42-1034(-)